MKVAFYLNNARVPDVDLTAPENGNPGLGGTHFLATALPWYMARFAADRVTPILYANHTDKLPAVETRQADDVLAAMRGAKEEGCDCFIDTAKETPVDVVAEADRLRLPTVFWIHNIVRHGHLRAAARSPWVRRVVCSAGEALDFIRDHAVGPKLALIPNGFDTSAFAPETLQEKDGRTVVYLGNLVKQKGFHLLARAWPDILARCPDARLRVIGTGRLYDRSVPLGPWGVATDTYEQRFLLPYLAADNGQPLPSVDFLGLLEGTDRIPVMRDAAVGVVNPSGQTENCPGSALEFQAAGTPVVSGAYWGLLDTVIHGETGLLGRTDQDLVDNICRLLEDRQRAMAMGRRGTEYVSTHYDYRDVVAAWIALLGDVSADRPASRVSPTKHFWRHLKWLRLANEAQKRAVPLLWSLPSVSETENFIRAVKKNLRPNPGRKAFTRS
ncbi:glycosyltransferase family 4 protein [Spiribacter sp. 218]|uniref:glycosyltransferase family 4 protein n=1 Tax=Spiribacter pallidus TaxID=1987936 RepID=UPI00349FB253